MSYTTTTPNTDTGAGTGTDTSVPSQRKRVSILDGGMSRELIRINAPFRQPEWSALSLIEAPDTVRQVHAEFIQAGADVVTTNTYALVPFHIGEDRFWGEAEGLAGLAGRLAREAVDQAVISKGSGGGNGGDGDGDGGGQEKKKTSVLLVAGSLPPIFGSYRPDLFDASRVQKYLDVLVRALAPYVDVWLGETLSLIAEAEAVRVATKHTDKPLWISFTIDDRSPESPSQLRSGESVTDAATWASNADMDGLLFNCSRPEYMAAAVRDAKAVFERHGKSTVIGVYANAFVQNSESYAANEDVSATRDDLDAERYVEFAREWVSNGATIVGGCCGVGCGHIRRLAEALKVEV